MTKTPDTAISAEMMKALQALMANGHAKKPKKAQATPEEKQARIDANAAECIRVFTKAGYKDVQPKVNVLTYGKVKEDGTVTGWLAKGRKVKAGEKGLAVGPFKLFHIDQTEEVVVGAVN